MITTDARHSSGDATIGVDVGGTSTRVARIGHDGCPVDLVVTPTPTGPVALTDHLIEQIELVRRSSNGVVGIGVGIPGRIDHERDTVSMAVNLGVDRPAPIRRDLEAALELPVVLGNDVDAAALGAARHLGVDGSLALLNVGTGLAAGFVLDGRLHVGRFGAGEVGHVPVPGMHQLCRCGQTGCAESAASGAAMLRAWGRPELSVGQLWSAADDGDRQAAEIRARCISTLAWLVQNVALLLDVDRIVIAGGVSRLGDRLLDPVRATIERRAATSSLLASFDLPKRLQLAPADIELGVIGAAALVDLAAEA